MITARIIIMLLVFGNLIWAIAKHDEPKEDYNGWTQFIATIITCLLYWWAGLFDLTTT